MTLTRNYLGSTKGSLPYKNFGDLKRRNIFPSIPGEKHLDPQPVNLTRTAYDIPLRALRKSIKTSLGTHRFDVRYPDTRLPRNFLLILIAAATATSSLKCTSINSSAGETPNNTAAATNNGEPLPVLPQVVYVAPEPLPTEGLRWEAVPTATLSPEGVLELTKDKLDASTKYEMILFSSGTFATTMELPNGWIPIAVESGKDVGFLAPTIATTASVALTLDAIASLTVGTNAVGWGIEGPPTWIDEQGNIVEMKMSQAIIEGDPIRGIFRAMNSNSNDRITKIVSDAGGNINFDGPGGKDPFEDMKLQEVKIKGKWTPGRNDTCKFEVWNEQTQSWDNIGTNMSQASRIGKSIAPSNSVYGGVSFRSAEVESMIEQGLNIEGITFEGEYVLDFYTK